MDNLDKFIDDWQESEMSCKKGFLHLRKIVGELDTVTLEFIQRQGLTSSLRAKREGQKSRPLFVMMDVIEGEPRWLSICFYADMVNDPQEKGDFVPQGLLGEDGLCFDVEEYTEELMIYLGERIGEAYENAQS